MAYKDPNYMTKWRKANREKCRGYDLKNYHNRQRFIRAGVTKEWYELQLSKQNGKCAICEVTPTENNWLCVDHNHTTGMIRGLLCIRCNTAIGLLDESIHNIEQAANYLIKHESKTN